jgi:hypothetical protein
MARPRKPRARARGQLFHKFHGNYWAVIVLVFDTAEEATAALPRLRGFEVGAKDPAALVMSAKGKGVDRAVRMLEKHRVGDKSEGIGGVAHSIDHGPDFELAVPVDLVKAAPASTAA